MEHRHAKPRFQDRDLAADRAMRDMQLLGGSGEVFKAGGDFECTQRL